MAAMFSRRHTLSRLEAFSDAVFAFALTLLVVSLDVPSTYDELMTLMAGFVPFAASFALLVWIWYEHTVFFRTYGLGDAWTTTLNAMLLFVVLFYVYPLKFLFTSAFTFFIPVLSPTVALSPDQLARIFAIYGAGFVTIFSIFALLYVQAYRRRDDLGLGPMEVLDTQIGVGMHLVSVAVGVLAIAVALLAPTLFAVLSGFTYFLMGPAHWAYAVMAARRKRALAAELAAASAPA